MINPLKVATGGYLKRGTKAVLVIAVAGYLNFNTVPPSSTSGGNGGVGKQNNNFAQQQTRTRERLIKNEEEDILTVLQIWAKCVV